MLEYLVLRAQLPRRYETEDLASLVRSFDRGADRTPVALDDVARAVRIGERLALLLRLGPQTCLFRALARYALLRRSGHAARLVLGIDGRDPGIGHAWVEIGGKAFLEPRSPAFVRTLELGAEPGG